MSETSIQSRPNPTSVLPVAPAQPRTDPWRYIKAPLKALASLRLTVFLFVLSMVLVFCGTLGMMDQGLFTVLSRYFRTFLAWIPLQVFVRFGQVFFGFPQSWSLSGSFPFPGGGTIGVALLINLLAAHAVRFRMTWKRAGILVIHSGLILMMLGEVVTWAFAVEGSMTIPLGGESNYVETFDRVELAFMWPKSEKEDNVVVVSEKLLRGSGPIHDDKLPVDIEVVRYLGNSTLSKEAIAPGPDNLATKGFGLRAAAIEQPPGRGVDAEQKRDMPSAYVTFRNKKTGESLGTYLVSLLLYPQEVEIGDTTYRVALRLQRTYKDYTFHLKELKHDTYRGTGIAKNYSSLIQVKGPGDVDREVLIYMNSPLYYQGETYYQSQVLAGGSITGLQVVRNPGWMLPYISCAMVALGMVVHFGIHLLSFIRRKVAV